MKKSISLYVIIYFLLFGCTTIPTPTPSPAPVTSPANSDIPNPTPVPPVQNMDGYYRIFYTENVLPEFYPLETDQGQTLHFTRENIYSPWATLPVSISITDFGPLFVPIPDTVQHLTSKGCDTYSFGINGSKKDVPNFNQKLLYFFPVCSNPTSEYTSVITLNMKGCTRESEEKVVNCKTIHEGTTLRYQLNLNRGTFTFNFTGPWQFDFKNWIHFCLKAFGIFTTNSKDDYTSGIA